MRPISLLKYTLRFCVLVFVFVFVFVCVCGVEFVKKCLCGIAHAVVMSIIGQRRWC